MLPIKGPGWALHNPSKISEWLPQPPGWWTQPGQPLCRPAHILLPVVLPASQEALLPSRASTRVLVAQTGQSGCHARCWRLYKPTSTHTVHTCSHTCINLQQHTRGQPDAHRDTRAHRRALTDTCSHEQSCSHTLTLTSAAVTRGDQYLSYASLDFLV